VKVMLEKNKKLVNTVYGTHKRTALILAADYGQLELVAYLLSQGSQIDQEDKHGITALLAAIYENHSTCVKLLLEKGADKNKKAPDGKSYYECAETKEIKAMLK